MSCSELEPRNCPDDSSSGAKIETPLQLSPEQANSFLSICRSWTSSSAGTLDAMFSISNGSRSRLNNSTSRGAFVKFQSSLKSVNSMYLRFWKPALSDGSMRRKPRKVLL